ncbi:MAG: 1-deoxy-D-xylulose-5-phosphate synthase [Planctomycetes bacterium]|nr:1-deoxy-D-xylulose-5-phosphate synthase [Planctomycetota bacterium]
MSSPILPRIHGPRDLKGLDAAQRATLVEELRGRICEVVSNQGGHFGANMGVVELTVALHTVFDSPRDRIVFDTSHQCYPHKLLTGRGEAFETLRTYGGLSGFCHKGESEHDTAFAGHAGTAVSIGLGIARAKHAQGSDEHTIAVVGDASLQSGMTLEALNHSGWLDEARYLVVFNDNGMSIDYPTGGLHATLQELRPWASAPELSGGEDAAAIEARKAAERGTSAARVEQFFTHLGLDYVGPIDGHDVEALIAACTELKERTGPVLLHIHTRKGQGWAPALVDPVAWHAAKNFYPPAPAPAQPKAAAQPKAKSWTDVFSEAMLALGAEDPQVTAITAAMPGGTGLKAFSERHPERFYDVGICEQHGAGFASGLAFAGLRPVLTVYSTFLQRCYDQVLHDVCLQQNPVVIAMDRAGLVGADGVTHQGLFDIAYLRCIPDIVLMAPSDEAELHAMLRWALESGQVVGLRWPRADAPPSLCATPDPIELGKGQIVANGDGRVALMAYGAMVEVALEARELLAAEGISVTVANARFAKPVDRTLLRSLLESHEVVHTLEDHTVVGGFGSACLEATLHEAPRLASKLRLAGVPDAFVHHGARELQLRDAGIDAEGIAERVRESLPRPSERWHLTAYLS